MRASPFISPAVSLATVTSVVLVHEFGHYLAARMFRIKVLEFCVGMGPKLVGFQAFGNWFNLRAFPLGGYLRFAGEEDDDSNQHGPDPRLTQQSLELTQASTETDSGNGFAACGETIQPFA